MRCAVLSGQAVASKTSTPHHTLARPPTKLQHPIVTKHARVQGAARAAAVPRGQRKSRRNSVKERGGGVRERAASRAARRRPAAAFCFREAAGG